MEDQNKAVARSLGPGDGVRDVQAVMEASGYVRHGGVMARGGSYDSCICPKAPCGGVATGTERADCPEHELSPGQVWHWAAECPGGGAAASPLGRAWEAKQRRDFGAEVDALVGGHRALTEASWYPSRPGDRLMVTLEAAGRSPRTTELYEVVEGESGSGLALRLIEITPEGAAGGWYAGPPEMYGTDPVETPWMEAGPDRLTLTRDGVIAHQGRHALARPDTAEARVTTAAGPDGVIGMAVVQEREYTPAELETLTRRILAQGAKAAARRRQENNAE